MSEILSLSSDLLERQFGETEIEILFQDGITRVIATRAIADRQVLEVSWVVFAADAAASFPGEYQDMRNGESMGKAFRAHGIEPERSVKDTCRYDLPPAFEPWFGSTEDATVIDLSVLVPPNRKLFAEVLEIFNPKVKWPYFTGEPTPDERRRIALLGKFLETRPKIS